MTVSTLSTTLSLRGLMGLNTQYQHRSLKPLQINFWRAFWHKYHACIYDIQETKLALEQLIGCDMPDKLPKKNLFVAV